jgi:hypothetical protein
MGLRLVGALLTAAPLFSQSGADPAVVKGRVQWLTLGESREDLARAMGPPRMIAPFGADFVAYQYQIGGVDHHDYSHQVVVRRSDGTVVSITRNYEPEIVVDEFFPEPETSAYRCQECGGYSVRVRKLSGGRLLLAMGVSRPGQRTGQLLLIRESELRVFLPWLAAEMTKQ